MIKGMLLMMLMLLPAAASTEHITTKIPWKGDYPHNSIKPWSGDNKDDSGFSKNFRNGAPEELGLVQKDGELNAEIILPNIVSGPIPFMIVLHGCAGLTTVDHDWAQHIADLLNPEGIGVLMLDSYTTRFVNRSCGDPGLHWGRRRAEDAYSALEYLVEHKYAKPDEVYLMGESNGGTTTLVAMTKEMNYHQYRFAVGFPVVPSCYSVALKYVDYYNPMIVFAAEKDDANKPEFCIEIMKKKRATPVQMVVYRGANHGFMTKAPDRVFNGWHLTYDARSEGDMMQIIISTIKTKKFVRGIEFR